MKKLFIIVSIIAIAIWGFFIEPNMLTVTHYSLKDDSLAGLKVVFLGDLHIRNNQQQYLQRLVNTINAQTPDIILSAGDFVNGYNANKSIPIEDIAKALGSIKTKYGFYTVLGNHDWWQNGEHITNVLKKNSITVLANNSVKVKDFYIAGVEDMTTRQIDITSTLANTHNPIILLTHSPDIFPKVPNTVNLTLAGHLHGGQIRLPLLGALIVPSAYKNKYVYGLINENEKKMIVTRGIGNSILNIRINCVPEIVVISFE